MSAPSEAPLGTSFDTAALSKRLGMQTYARGQDLYNSGCVEDVQILDNRIEGVVQDKNGESFKQVLLLKDRPDEVGSPGTELEFAL